ncbi:hypothetical protein U5922_000345 (plasmid) [Aquicoccus sp. G2-2]|uniref:hypothetical protein n=1 Tax=Aquicoccus sp. G2-2 TaxID=3092120 RepID=UPI002ADF1E5B|nr:hypothetical protein [Aquicoccus sp. G2-2]MEA1111984.1 hypothetical protein [Aquicoccus sp. G2-2]
MGGVMLDLSSNVKAKLADYSPNKVLELPTGRLLLYIDLKAAEILETCGYLNVVFEDLEGRSYVIEKAALGDGKDTSAIVSGSVENGLVLLGHWRGFESVFDSETLCFERQRITK